MYYLLTLLFLSLLIVAHESGHFLMARWLKVPVAEFSVGMGPKIVQVKRNQTRFSLRWILLGGYCAFDTPEALEAGTVKLVGTDYMKITESVSALLDCEDNYEKMSRAVNPYGDGEACGRIVKALE